VYKVLRYLLIAIAAWSGLACVLLVFLWVRSYWRLDNLAGPTLWPYGFSATSTTGRLMIGGGDEQDPITQWELTSLPFDDRYNPVLDSQFYGPVFAFYPSEDEGSYIHVPHWFPALIAGSIAFAFAKRRRYSLRTVLIVTTLIALSMGAIVYYAKHADQGGMTGSGNGGLAGNFRHNFQPIPLTTPM
jgi:hypothetical protein